MHKRENHRSIGNDRTHGTCDEASGVSGADAAEFRAAIGQVRRLPDAPAVSQPPKPRAAAAMRQADERAALVESRMADPERDADRIGDAVLHRRNEVPPEILRRLRRAEFAIEDEIDLHALSERAAGELLRRFLADARDAGHHCVRIVHGKGLHSAQAPVLKGLVERMLDQRADVMAYATPPASQGGTGALLVLLGKRKPGGRRPGAPGS